MTTRTHHANQAVDCFVASLKIEATIDLLQYLPTLKIVEMSAQHQSKALGTISDKSIWD